MTPSSTQTQQPTFLTMVWFYIQVCFLSILVHLKDGSHVLQHPHSPIPYIIASQRNRTLRTFYLNAEMYSHLTRRLPHIPSPIRWLETRQVENRIVWTWNDSIPLTITGDLQGPPIDRGMLVFRGSRAVYIQEELGYLPTTDTIITASGISLDTETIHPLLIPTRLIANHCLPTPPTRTQEAQEYIQEMRRYENVLNIV